MIYADSSALVKLYADEPHSEMVRGAADLLVSAVARVEVPAALWRKVRTGDLEPGMAAVLVAGFEADYRGTPDRPPRFITLAADRSVLEKAAALTAVHPLRAYDAVQLATALIARAVIPTCAGFLAFDIQLRSAAAAEGFTLSPTTL